MAQPLAHVLQPDVDPALPGTGCWYHSELNRFGDQLAADAGEPGRGAERDVLGRFLSAVRRHLWAINVKESDAL